MNGGSNVVDVSTTLLNMEIFFKSKHSDANESYDAVWKKCQN